MKKIARRAMIGAAVVVLSSTGAAMAQGFEGGWFGEVDRLENLAGEARGDAEDAAQRADELDLYLAETLTDADTARRVERELKRGVALEVARWDAHRRGAHRQKQVGGPGSAEAVKRALQASKAPVTEDWQRDVRLARELSQGIDDAGSLLVRRGDLEISQAYGEALVALYAAQRQQVIARVANGEGQEEIARETEKNARALEEELERLRDLPASEDFHRRKGALIPPVPGQPDHPFGPRRREGSFTEIRHTGVTYLIDAGAEVRSVAGGEAVLAQRLPGFGKVVIVDHGGGYHSLYAHLQEFSVEVGDEVRARQMVGLSGETGSLEGPKFYFELRRQGRPVDPQQWFVSN